MLCISRGRDGAIRIGESIRVNVLRTARNRVVLGIEAPPGVRVIREEIALAEKPAEPEAA